MDLTGIDMNNIPRHVAAVMDGNGRWATQRGLKRTEGHAAGEEALFDTLHNMTDVPAVIEASARHDVDFLPPEAND